MSYLTCSLAMIFLNIIHCRTRLNQSQNKYQEYNILFHCSCPPILKKSFIIDTTIYAQY